MYEIDDDVPAPEYRPKHQRKYPFTEMKVGDSFFVAAGDEHATVVRNRICSAARPERLTNGFKIATKLRTEDGVPGVRCWRVE